MITKTFTQKPLELFTKTVLELFRDIRAEHPESDIDEIVLTFLHDCALDENDRNQLCKENGWFPDELVEKFIKAYLDMTKPVESEVNS